MVYMIMKFIHSELGEEQSVSRTIAWLIVLKIIALGLTMIVCVYMDDTV